MCPVTLAALGTSIGVGTAAAAGGVAAGAAAVGGSTALGAAGAAALAAGATAAAPATFLGLTAAQLGAVSLATSVAATTASQVSANQQAKAQNNLVSRNASLQRSELARVQGAEAEATATRLLDLSRQEIRARGQVKASNLGDRSVRAIGRSIGFEVGTDKATIRRNQELANEAASARLQGFNLNTESQRLQIGDTSGLGLGLQIGGSLLQGGTALGVNNLRNG